MADGPGKLYRSGTMTAWGLLCCCIGIVLLSHHFWLESRPAPEEPKPKVAPKPEWFRQAGAYPQAKALEAEEPADLANDKAERPTVLPLATSEQENEQAFDLDAAIDAADDTGDEAHRNKSASSSPPSSSPPSSSPPSSSPPSSSPPKA